MGGAGGDAVNASGGVDRLASALAHAGEDPFVGVVQATRTAVAITDYRSDDNVIVFVNDSFCRLTGYSREELVGRNCRLLQGPDTDRAKVAAIRAAVAAGQPIETDLLNYRKDGTPFWNRLALAPVFDAARNVTFYFGSQVDVTAERERLAALESRNADLLEAQRISEERLRVATEAGQIGVWELSLPDLTLTATATLGSLFGLPAGTIPTFAMMRDRVHPDDFEVAAAAFDQALSGEAPNYRSAVRIVHEHGGISWLESRGEVERAPDGTALRLVGIAQDVTARRLAEAQLELSQESLRLATEAAGIGTWDLDLETGVLTWPARTKAMFGLSPDAPCSMADFYAGLHPDDLAATSAAFAAALDPGTRAVYDVEYRTIGREDGVVRWIAAKGKGLFVEDRCVRAIGTAIDITRHRRQARHQAVLLALSDRIRTLGDPDAILAAAAAALGRELKANRVGYSQIDDDAGRVRVSTPFLHEAEPFAGEFPLASFGPELIAVNRAGATVVIPDILAAHRIAPGWQQLGTRGLISVPLIRDGRLRASLFVMCNGEGAWDADDIALVEAVAARTWEAAERARAEAERLASEARLRSVIAAAPVGLIFAAAPDGRITGGNAKFEEMMGHALLESPNVAGYRDYVSFHDDGRRVEAEEYPLARALAGEERAELDALYRRGDGAEVYLRFIAAPIRGTGGTIVGSVVTALDIDRERRAEMALRDLNATLERRVEERTRDLLAAEEALRQAQKMDAVGQLTGGIAHDFNNMLAVVLGSLELLSRRLPEGDQRARRYVEAATDGARRAATLTQRLLAFSRQQPLQPEPTDVNRLLGDMSELLRGSLGGGIHIETVLARDVWPVHADPNQLENVILNLAINARDAMAGEGRLTIETANAALDDRYAESELGVAPGEYVLVAVSDTGSGMPREVISKAFDPFFTTKSVGKGTGLGLSQVYGFVKQSGGHVKIYSEVGVGTTVKLYLPRLVGASVSAPAPAVEYAPVGRARSELILVVEDEPGVRAVTVEALNTLGYRVLEADSAVAALRLLEAHANVALLFTDIVMPEVNGARLAEAARAMRPGLKVLFTTGYTRNAVVHNGIVDPGVDLLGKPFTVEALAAKVRTVLDR